MKKMSKKTVYAIAIALCLLILCACEKRPIENIVKSKNDGSFDVEIVQSSEKKHVHSPLNVEYSEEFPSTDGTLNYKVRIDKEVSATNMPVVEVAPHYLSSEDVQRVAMVLFGNADFYEAEPMLSLNLSKAEIQERIQRWSKYTNESSINELYGSVGNPTDIVDIVKNFIAEYTAHYEIAVDNNPHIDCQWEFKKESVYLFPEKAINQNLENDNDAIYATVKDGDIQYIFTASTRNKEDYKLNNINVSLYSGISPNLIDERIFRAKLCRTEEPTEQQISSITKKAEKMLEEMELGDWKIDRCFVDTTYYGDIPEYKICINAVPFLNDVPSIRRPQLNNLKSKEVYASNYYLSDVNFEFSADGKLVSFKMYSPVDIKEIVNDNAKVQSMDELMKIAKNNLSLRDIYSYGLGSIVNRIDEKVSCTVCVTGLEYGLTRVKKANTDSSYYYVPALMLNGSVECIGKKSKEIYYVSEEPEILIIINAIDGSIINSTNS